MAEQERPLVDRVWEFTKDLSVKVSRKAEKHWKINTLRVEIASIKHRINVKYKDLGRYVYESLKSGTLEEDSYKASVGEFFDELARLEGEIVDREHRIEILEQEMSETPSSTEPSAEAPEAEAAAETVNVPPPPILPDEEKTVSGEVPATAKASEEEPATVTASEEESAPAVEESKEDKTEEAK